MNKKQKPKKEKGIEKKLKDALKFLGEKHVCHRARHVQKKPVQFVLHQLQQENQK